MTYRELSKKILSLPFHKMADDRDILFHGESPFCGTFYAYEGPILNHAVRNITKLAREHRLSGEIVAILLSMEIDKFYGMKGEI